MDFDTLNKAIDEISNRIFKVHMDYLHLWRDNILMSWRWWAALALAVIPWIIWILIRKKDSTCRLLFAGLLALIIGSFLDMIGTIFFLWDYPTTILPLMPDYIYFDFSVLPVVTMLFIQFFPKIKPVVKGILYACAGALVFQPLMEWLGLYDHERWKNWFSIPFLFGIYVLADFVSKRKSFGEIGQPDKKQ